MKHAYKEFEEKVEASPSGGRPEGKVSLVRKVLADLKREGRIALTGYGRGARWRVIRRG